MKEVCDAFKEMVDLMKLPRNIDGDDFSLEPKNFLVFKYLGILDIFSSMSFILEKKSSFENKGVPRFFEYPFFSLARNFFELVTSTAIIGDYYLRNDKDQLDQFFNYYFNVWRVFDKYQYRFEDIDVNQCKSEIEELIRSRKISFAKNKSEKDLDKQLEKLGRGKSVFLHTIFNKPESFDKYSNTQEWLNKAWELTGRKKDSADPFYYNLSLATHGNIHYLMQQYNVKNNEIKNFYKITAINSMSILAGIYVKYFTELLESPKKDGNRMLDITNKFHLQ